MPKSDNVFPLIPGMFVSASEYIGILPEAHVISPIQSER